MSDKLHPFLISLSLSERREDAADQLAVTLDGSEQKGKHDPELLSALADGEIDREDAKRLIPLFLESLETTAQMYVELELIAGEGE